MGKKRRERERKEGGGLREERWEKMEESEKEGRKKAVITTFMYMYG